MSRHFQTRVLQDNTEMYSFYQFFTSHLHVDSSSFLLFVSSFTLLNLVPQIFGWEWSYGVRGACFSEEPEVLSILDVIRIGSLQCEPA